jgi:hypothetical protein
MERPQRGLGTGNSYSLTRKHASAALRYDLQCICVYHALVYGLLQRRGEMSHRFVRVHNLDH